jgi:DNA-binding GntR family transcriptional regulator
MMVNMWAVSTRRFEQASLAGQAYLFIREGILRGELPLGTALSRRKLAGGGILQ